MDLNVVSFNLRYRDDEGNNTIAERAPRLRQILGQYDTDILCFQEISRTWQPYLEKDYESDFDMYLQYRNETTTGGEAIAILWRRDKFQCLHRGVFWLSDTPEVESRGWDELFNCFRICQYVILKDLKSGQSFTVMNTHYGFGDKGQIDSCNLVYEYSKKISDLPTFVIGDFNMNPASPAYGVMTKLFRDVNSCTANDLRPTWHGYEPEVVTSAHIDYCFVDEKITPVQQQMMTDTVDGYFPSDHYGIYCTIAIEPPLA